MKTRLGGRTWAALLTFGLFGQIAWVIENMYFNVFLYNTISGDTSMIAAMVAWSAVTATVTTLVMGALSDRLGRRKALIVIGYLLWGVSIGAFAFIKFVGPYSKGQYYKFPHVARCVAPKVVRIRSEKPDIVTCLDGECITSDDVTIRLSDKRLNFFGPTGCDCNRTARDI